MKKSAVHLKIAILSIAAIGSMNVFVAPALAVIAQAFPTASPTAIQMIMTAAMVGQFPMTFIAGFAATRIRIKKILVFGIMCIMVGGFLPLALHGDLIYLYICAGLMGVGQGTCLTMMTTLINTRFTGEERSKVLGWQNSVIMFSLMIMMAVAGGLASIHWTNVYYITLLAVPVLILVTLWLPMGDSPKALAARQPQSDEPPKAKGVVPPPIIVLAIFASLFAIGFATIVINTAMLIDAREIGGGAPWVAGLMSSFSYLVSIVAGLIYRYVLRAAKHLILFCGAVSMAVGLFVVYNAYVVPVYAIGEIFIYMGFTMGFLGGIESIGRIVKPEWVSSCMGIYLGFDALGSMLAPYVINRLAGTVLGSVTPGNALLVGSIWIACTSALALCWGIWNRGSFADLRRLKAADPGVAPEAAAPDDKADSAS